MVMTDLSDTTDLARPYCPGCEPQANEVAEILQVRWCMHHEPKRDGPDDDAAKTDRMMGSSGEADGHDCRTIQRYIR